MAYVLPRAVLDITANGLLCSPLPRLCPLRPPAPAVVAKPPHAAEISLNKQEASPLAHSGASHVRKDYSLRLACCFGFGVAREPECGCRTSRRCPHARTARSAFLAILATAGSVRTRRERGMVSAKRRGCLSQWPRSAIESLLWPYARIATLSTRLHPVSGGSPSEAVVATTANVAPRLAIGPCCVVEAAPYSASGSGGRRLYHPRRRARLRRHATDAAGHLVSGVTIGARCCCKPGAVIGADGFGFGPMPVPGSMCRKWKRADRATIWTSGVRTRPSTAVPSRQGGESDRRAWRNTGQSDSRSVQRGPSERIAIAACTGSRAYHRIVASAA